MFLRILVVTGAWLSVIGWAITLFVSKIFGFKLFELISDFLEVRYHRVNAYYTYKFEM